MADLIENDLEFLDGNVDEVLALSPILTDDLYLRLVDVLDKGLLPLAGDATLPRIVRNRIACRVVERHDGLAASVLLAAGNLSSESVRKFDHLTPAMPARYVSLVSSKRFQELVGELGEDVPRAFLSAVTWEGSVTSLVQALKDDEDTVPIMLQDESTLYRLLGKGLSRLERHGRTVLDQCNTLHPVTQDLLVRLGSRSRLLHYAASHPGMDASHQHQIHTIHSPHLNATLGHNPHLDPALVPDIVQGWHPANTISKHNPDLLATWCTQQEVDFEVVRDLGTSWRGTLDELVEATHLVNR